jgi:hypothetical protein
VVLALDPQGSLIHVQGGLGEERLDGGALPLGQGVMQLQDPLQQGRFGDDLLDEGGQRVLHPLQCHHLGDQQVQDEGLDPGAVLQRAGQIRREAALGQRLTAGAGLELGIDMAHHLLEDDVDAGAPLVTLTGRIGQIGTAAGTGGDGSDGDGLDRAGVAGALQGRFWAVGLAAGPAGGVIVLGGARGGHAGVAAVLQRALFHEHRHQQLE